MPLFEDPESSDDPLVHGQLGVRTLTPALFCFVLVGGGGSFHTKLLCHVQDADGPPRTYQDQLGGT